MYVGLLRFLFMNGTGLSTGFFFFIEACLLITEINSDSKFSYAEFTLSL
jgi:hypothetical protein